MAKSMARGSVTRLRNRMSEAERETRINLAAAFRVAHQHGWNNTVNNHIAARVPDEPDAFLMNPVGLGWHEIRASDLIKSDFDGNYRSETTMRLAPAGFNFHSAILREKTNLNCTFHIHPLAVVLVSAMEDGLMFFDQSSCALYGQVSYHDFEGLAQEKDEAPRIIADLGDNFAMIMRNHGALTVGRTIGEAFTYMRRLIGACEVQSRLLACGVKLRKVPQNVLEFTRSQMDARHPDRPYGELDWAMYRRLAEQLDPGFKD